MLVSGERLLRLGSLSSRSLGLAGPLGLDLDLIRAVGMGSVPLWALGDLLLALVLGSDRSARYLRHVLAGARRLRRRGARLLGLRLVRWRRVRRVVSARAARSVGSLVDSSLRQRQCDERHLRQPHLCHGREPE